MPCQQMAVASCGPITAQPEVGGAVNLTRNAQTVDVPQACSVGMRISNCKPALPYTDTKPAQPEPLFQNAPNRLHARRER